jgi:hypothetical protein
MAAKPGEDVMKMNDPGLFHTLSRRQMLSLTAGAMSGAILSGSDLCSQIAFSQPSLAREGAPASGLLKKRIDSPEMR